VRRAITTKGTKVHEGQISSFQAHIIRGKNLKGVLRFPDPLNKGHWGGMTVYNSIVLRAFIEDDDEHPSAICFLFRGEA
jgi:hypothetical protein